MCWCNCLVGFDIVYCNRSVNCTVSLVDHTFTSQMQYHRKRRNSSRQYEMIEISENYGRARVVIDDDYDDEQTEPVKGINFANVMTSSSDN